MLSELLFEICGGHKGYWRFIRSDNSTLIHLSSSPIIDASNWNTISLVSYVMQNNVVMRKQTIVT